MTSTVCQTVQQVTGMASAAASAAPKTVQKLTKTAKNLLGSSSGSASSAHQSQSRTRTQRHARRSASESHPAVGTAPANVGVLLTDGPLALSTFFPPQQLVFPTVYPARHTAALAAAHSSRVPSRVWLLFLIAGVALAASYFLGWVKLRQRRARTTA